MSMNCSILSDIDTLIDAADASMDPFNILGVTCIKIDPGFRNLFTLIDYDALCKETPSFNSTLFNEINTPDFLIESEQQMICVRFAWYICNGLLCGDLNGVFFNIDKFSNYGYTLHLYRYKVTTDKDAPRRIGIQLPSGAQLTIFHKNKINNVF